MKRNITGRNGRLILSGLSKPWSTAPWRSAHRIGAHHGYRIDGAEHAQGSAAGEAENRESSGSSTNRQLAALNTWEGEGGRIAAPVKAEGVQ
jgi:hypothetical protein